MRVLTITVDVTDLTEQETEDLQLAMEVQCEGAGSLGEADDLFDAPIITSSIKEDDEDTIYDGTQQH